MAKKSNRIQSIDILRGLTVALMIFVNNIAGVTGVPAWLAHAPVGYDAMYLADIVFSLFLFWVGMSVPLAIEGQHRKGVKDLDILAHILKRTVNLLFIGVLMVNIDSLSSEKSGIDSNLWAFLMYVGVIASWRVYGKEKTQIGKWIGIIVHYIGIALLVYLVLIFRTSDGGWITPQWWGILGLIGWAYLATAVCYLFFRNNFTHLVLLFIGLLTYHAIYSGFPVLKSYAGWFALSSYGGHAALSFAGMMATLVMLKYRTSISKFFKIWGFSGLFFFVMAFLSRPIWGIQKDGASPSWVWLSIAIGLWLLILVWFLVEKRGYTSWALVFKPAGTDTFFAYLLQSSYYNLFWLLGLSYPVWLNHSIGGFIRSLIVSILLIQLTGLLARKGIRLKL